MGTTKEKRISTKLLRDLIVKSSARVGDEFLNSIVIDLASIINSDHTFIGRLIEENTMMESVSYCASGQLQNQIRYDLKGTPCAEVTNRGVCAYPAKVASVFPDDQMLKDMGIEGYVGVPLIDSAGDPLGIIVSLFCRPIEDTDFAEAILQLFATRASNEIEKQKSQEELEATRQKYFHIEKIAAIGELSAGILHEVGNPLAAISGSIELINLSRKDWSGELNPELSSLIDIIDTQVGRLGSIVKEISSFSSPNPGATELLSINDLLTNTTNLMRFDRRFKETELVMNLGSDLPAVVGIPDQLVQVFMNLLSNAVDACERVPDRQSVLSIRSSLDNDMLHVELEDNGIGMPKEIINKATEAFFSTKKSGSGIGLGLSLCNSIIDRQHGSMRLESLPGTGTTAHIFLQTREIKTGIA
jgi:signal transduction histidine kinase